MGRVLVLGGTGKLGTALVRELTARGEQVAAPSRAELDLLGGGLEPAVAEASLVINAAAYNHVDAAELEENREQAFRLNRDAPGEMARACAAAGIPFVHVSTDYVFNGRGSEPYREEDPTDPAQTYGRTKLEGERAVLEAWPDAVVARTSTVYGQDRRGGSNYVTAILGQARRSAALEVAELPVSSPTYALDLARGLLSLLACGARGLVHVTNAGGCSRLQLATEVVRLAGLAPRVEIRTRPAATGGAARPAYSVLDVSRIERITGRPMRPWQDALADYLRTLGRTSLSSTSS